MTALFENINNNLRTRKLTLDILVRTEVPLSPKVASFETL